VSKFNYLVILQERKVDMTQLKEFVQSKKKLTINIAKHETVERILNAYLRETQVFDPRIKNPSEQIRALFQKGDPFCMNFKETGVTIIGELTFWSAGGQHAYGSELYKLLDFNCIPLNSEQVISHVLDEIAYTEVDEDIRQRKQEVLLVHIENSVQKTDMYIKHCLSKRNDLNPIQDYIHSEQSLYAGHPFHPTPKSSEGFTEQDIEKYAPELGVSFTLCYFAISPELILEEWIEDTACNHSEHSIPNDVIEEAKGKLDLEKQGYKLLPCHPWQAQYLTQNQWVIEYQKQGKIVNLGPLGNVVYPTSSVRTVWDPKHDYFYKLPLHVRITNFIRNNTREQIKRSLDAAKVIAKVRDKYENESFSILMEYGFRTVSLPMSCGKDGEDVMDDFSVLFRQNPKECKGNDAIYVVGSLMENPPDEITSAPWFSHYLKVTMTPVLNIFAEMGVSLEAHAQNSLIKIEHGLPVKFVVRDLEGISIDKDQALKNGWIDSVISKESSVLYEKEEAWFRLKYYYFVNHLGYVVRTLAKLNDQDEYHYWRIVRTTLQEMKQKKISKTLEECIHNLLEGEWLPAKANLISRFQECGESPLFVNIPNPIYECEVK
jgi:siderophore synthetase component